MIVRKSKMSSPSLSNLPSVSGNNQNFIEPTNDQTTQPVSKSPGKDGTRQTQVDNGSRPRPWKLTRGEKCLLTHIVVTFVLLVILLIIFIVHLYLVRHHENEMFEGMFRRRIAEEQSDYAPVGVVYVLPDNYMCNSLLLRARWSLAPAHCVAARSDPDLAYALPSWRIMYGRNTDLDETEEFLETKITRSVPHPHFNRDDFQNNIGLLQHGDPIPIVSYAYNGDMSLSDHTFGKNANDLKLIGWEDSSKLRENHVQPLSSEKCKLYVSPVVDKRDYEYCVTLTERRNVTIAPGAVLKRNSEYVGMFTWGDSKGRGLPFVILDLAHYKAWILHSVATGVQDKRPYVTSSSL